MTPPPRPSLLKSVQATGECSEAEEENQRTVKPALGVVCNGRRSLTGCFEANIINSKLAVDEWKQETQASADEGLMV